MSEENGIPNRIMGIRSMITRTVVVPFLSPERRFMEAVEEKKTAAEKHGLKLSIDDFGAGINNMEIVNLYSPHIVKLDRELISYIDEDKFKQEFVKQHVAEFHRRKIAIVGEGIERKEEYEVLMSLGVEYYQGYYFARPA